MCACTYLFERLDVLVRTVLDGRVGLGGRFELRVALGLAAGERDLGALLLGLIHCVVVVVALVGDELLVGLCDLSWVWLELVGKDHLDLESDRLSGGQRRLKVDLVQETPFFIFCCCCC